MTTFIPDFKAEKANTVPFFEDSQHEVIPGRGTTKKVSELQREVSDLMTKLGAFGIQFTPGQYPGSPKRYGFQIHFRYANTTGRLDCAALPLRKETEHKKDRALAQALFLLRDKLQAMVYAHMYEPGSVPLLPYLISPVSGQTVTEFLVSSGNLPQLGSGK